MTTMTFDEQERRAFADGDTRTAALIRDVYEEAIDEGNFDHQTELDDLQDEIDALSYQLEVATAKLPKEH